MASSAPEAEVLPNRADAAVEQMRQATQGKPMDRSLETNVRSLSDLADLVAELAADSRRKRGRTNSLEAALTRIANLRIRSGAELVERGDWKKIASELQSIAQEMVRH